MFKKTILIEDTIKNILVGLSAGIRGAVYLGNEEFRKRKNIVMHSSINDILSTFD